MTEEKKLISIISPVYNEEKSIPIFYRQLQQIIKPYRAEYDFEIIFTNNRSEDNSLAVLQELHQHDKSVSVLTMSKNFGYQASIQAGFSYAKGDAMVVVDADCEDPLEMIPRFISKWEEGYDIVYGLRDYKNGENWLVKKCRKLFYRALRLFADMDIVLYMAEFALIAKPVRDAIINNKNTFPFLRSEIGYVGFSRFGIPYDRQPRHAGKTSYNLFRMFSFAVAGFLTSSTFFFRLFGYLFPLLFLVNIPAFLWLPTKSILFRSIVFVDFLYVTFILTIQGVYLARIYKNIIGRPIFVIDKKLSYTGQSSSGNEAQSNDGFDRNRLSSLLEQ